MPVWIEAPGEQVPFTYGDVDGDIAGHGVPVDLEVRTRLGRDS